MNAAIRSGWISGVSRWWLPPMVHQLRVIFTSIAAWVTAVCLMGPRPSGSLLHTILAGLCGVRGSPSFESELHMYLLTTWIHHLMWGSQLHFESDKYSYIIQCANIVMYIQSDRFIRIQKLGIPGYRNTNPVQKKIEWDIVSNREYQEYCTIGIWFWKFLLVFL